MSLDAKNSIGFEDVTRKGSSCWHKEALFSVTALVMEATATAQLQAAGQKCVITDCVVHDFLRLAEILEAL